MISIVSWSKGLKEYRQIWSQREGMLFNNPDFLNFQRKQFIQILGFRIKLPALHKYFFVRYKFKDIVVLTPCKLKWGGVEILCEPLFPKKTDSKTRKDYLVNIVIFLRNKYKHVIFDSLWHESIDDIKEHFRSVLVHSIDCASIDISEGYESWKSRLSKSSRQNQRTAYNRLKTDQLTFDFKSHIGQISKKRLFHHLYLHRYRNFERRNCKAISLLRPLIWLTSWIDVCFDPWCQFITHEDSSFLTEIFIEEGMAACLCGMIVNNRLLIPYLSYNSKYRRYDPGRILINESIRFLAENHLATDFDLYKGVEQYKFDNGGKGYSIFSLEL